MVDNLICSKPNIWSNQLKHHAMMATDSENIINAWNQMANSPNENTHFTHTIQQLKNVLHINELPNFEKLSEYLLWFLESRYYAVIAVIHFDVSNDAIILWVEKYALNFSTLGDHRFHRLVNRWSGHVSESIDTSGFSELFGFCLLSSVLILTTSCSVNETNKHTDLALISTFFLCFFQFMVGM